MKEPLISIIMPVFNSELYISEAIDSVINQTYHNWELIIINDGSTDNSKNKISQFSDKRISVYEQQNSGVSSARNVGLQKMKGSFFCFLDSDDVLPPDSLKFRLIKLLDDNKTNFVDGRVEIWNENFSKILSIYSPSYNGFPKKELIKLSNRCFFGPTWLIRRNVDFIYKMRDGLSHGEDLMFYYDISHLGQYSYVDDVVLKYRKNSASAMSNLDGLLNGYIFIVNEIKKDKEISWYYIFLLKYKVMSFMAKAFIKKKHLSMAFISIIKVFKA